jgi:predicted O-methyltransferase YrrM
MHKIKLGIVMASAPSEQNLITHTKKHNSFDIVRHSKRLREAEGLALPLDEELSLLEQLTRFELGRYMLEKGGLNGYWTAYLILNAPKSKLSSLEYWLLNHTPVVMATRERYHIFRKQAQKYVRPNVKIASIPCGLMDGLLSLDYYDAKGAQLVGIDLDSESIALAKANVRKYGKMPEISFIKRDAWQLEMHNAFHLITSNGLNFYEPNDDKVVALYRQFHQALKPQGVLVTSFLTPSPALSPQSSWLNYDPEAERKQRALFTDIVQGKWQAYRTEEQTRAQLEAVGFRVLEVIYDRQGMFPTMVAQKIM